MRLQSTGAAQPGDFRRWTSAVWNRHSSSSPNSRQYSVSGIHGANSVVKPVTTKKRPLVRGLLHL